MDQYILLPILMIGAGLLGGITNYFRSDQEKKDSLLFLKNVFMGVSASLLIPLFLNMISSNLLKESASDSLKYFILFGFCLIASLSSKAFIQTISDRLLNEVRKTEEKLENIKTDVKAVLDKETEPAEEEEENKDSLSKIRAFSFDEDTKKVLNALGKGRYAWRSLTGIAKEIGLPKETVLKSLNWLLSNFLVVRTVEKGRWGLSLEGRDIFSEMSSAIKSKQEDKE